MAAAGNAGGAGKKSVCVVVDVQKGFLFGGNLATTASAEFNAKFTQNVYNYINSVKFSTVYFTKDMHHPLNVSIGQVTETENVDEFHATTPFEPLFYKNTSKNGPKNSTNPTKSKNGSGFDATYKGKLTTPIQLERTWLKNSYGQAIWPVHCILPKDDPWYPILVGDKSPMEKYYHDKLYNTSTTEGGNGADLPGALSVYDGDKVESPFDYYFVYKGFGQNIDSYSAVADAFAWSTPFVAKSKEGGFLDKAATPATPFYQKLLDDIEGGVTDIYVLGIATNFCVLSTAKDIMELVVKPSGKAVTVHFVHNLTIPIPGYPNISVDHVTADLKTVSGVNAVVEDAPDIGPMPGGRRRRTRHRSRRHHKRSTKRSHKRCHCGKPRGHKGYRSCQ